MFHSINEFVKSKFYHESDKTTSDESIQLASAVLMFEVIKSDNQIDDIEIDYLHKILKEKFDLPDQDLKELVELAKNSAEDSISLHDFTRTVCKNWDNNQRQQLLTNLWVIAFADNKIDAHERHIIRKIAGLLYLNDKQISQARESAKKQLNL